MFDCSYINKHLTRDDISSSIKNNNFTIEELEYISDDPNQENSTFIFYTRYHGNTCIEIAYMDVNHSIVTYADMFDYYWPVNIILHSAGHGIFYIELKMVLGAFTYLPTNISDDNLISISSPVFDFNNKIDRTENLASVWNTRKLLDGDPIYLDDISQVKSLMYNITLAIGLSINNIKMETKDDIINKSFEIIDRINNDVFICSKKLDKEYMYDLYTIRNILNRTNRILGDNQ